jgi:hypothetical protein
MVIDFTAELAPLLWSILALLLISTAALVASIDPEIAEIYIGDRRLLVATAAVAVVALVALIAARPDIAAGFGLPFP